MRKLNPREFVNITPLLTACDSEFRRRGLGGQLSSRSAWWSQLGTESLVLGLPDSPKCPHRKYSAGVAVMGPHTQGYAPRTYLGTAVWPAIQNLPTHWVGEKWLISCQLEIQGLRVKTEVDLWEMEEVVFVTCLCLTVISATCTSSL